MSRMGRHLEFDIETAKKAAIKLFWSKGYQAATLDLLCDCMQIGRSSFYSTFKDKKSLFIGCIDTYLEGIKKNLTRYDFNTDTIEDIREAYLLNFVNSRHPRAHLGCMLANIAVELADVDDDLVKIIFHKLQVVDEWRVQWFVQMGCSREQAVRLGHFAGVFTDGLQAASRRKTLSQQMQDVIHTGFDFLAAELASIRRTSPALPA